MKDKPKIVSLHFKHEGHQKGVAVGPLTTLLDNGDTGNYMNGDPIPGERGRFYAAWFPLNVAMRIADKLKVPLEEH